MPLVSKPYLELSQVLPVLEWWQLHALKLQSVLHQFYYVLSFHFLVNETAQIVVALSLQNLLFILQQDGLVTRQLWLQVCAHRLALEKVLRSLLGQVSRLEVIHFLFEQLPLKRVFLVLEFDLGLLECFVIDADGHAHLLPNEVRQLQLVPNLLFHDCAVGAFAEDVFDALAGVALL